MCADFPLLLLLRNVLKVISRYHFSYGNERNMISDISIVGVSFFVVSQPTTYQQSKDARSGINNLW